MAETRTLHSVSLRGVIIPALVVFVAVAWWASRDSGVPAANDSASTNAASSPAMQSAGRNSRPATTQSVD